MAKQPKKPVKPVPAKPKKAAPKLTAADRPQEGHQGAVESRCGCEGGQAARAGETDSPENGGHEIEDDEESNK